MGMLTIKEFQETYKNDGYMVDIWRDWFCSTEALSTRLKRVAPAIKALRDNPRFTLEDTEVFIKNMCPDRGGTFERVFLSDIKTDKVLYTIENNPRDIARGLGPFQVYDCMPSPNGVVFHGTPVECAKFLNNM